MIPEDELLEFIRGGGMFDGPDQLPEEYRRELVRTLTITMDTELMGAVIHYHNLYHGKIPDDHISGFLALAQDELGHANLACRLLADLGVDSDDLIFGRLPEQFRHPYAMDMLHETFPESVVSLLLYDRAGYILLGDIYHSTSYLPWRRSLVRVDRDERFHVRYGERATRLLCQTPDGRDAIQRALDWMFPLTVEWFGLPDARKTHDRQTVFRIKGKSNDQLRQEWLSQVVPIVNGLGLSVPARYDSERAQYVLEFPFPCHFDPAGKRWDFSLPVTWAEVIGRWKARGPANRGLITLLQSGRRQMEALEAGW